MKRILADLHIHTALSPCASDEMTPPAIVAAARRKGLGLIAICDHNSAGNVAAVRQAARGKPAVLAGVEIETSEQAHVLGIFPTVLAAKAAGAAIGATLQEGGDEYFVKFGRQSMMDASGQEIAMETRKLASSSRFTLVQAVSLIHRGGGLAIASHVDRPRQSVISQLGLIPDGAALDAIELSSHCREKSKYAAIGLPMITASDSHYLEDVGTNCLTLQIREASFDELRMALLKSAGRSCCGA